MDGVTHRCRYMHHSNEFKKNRYVSIQNYTFNNGKHTHTHTQSCQNKFKHEK